MLRRVERYGCESRWERVVIGKNVRRMQGLLEWTAANRFLSRILTWLLLFILKDITNFSWDAGEVSHRYFPKSVSHELLRSISCVVPPDPVVQPEAEAFNHLQALSTVAWSLPALSILIADIFWSFPLAVHLLLLPWKKGSSPCLKSHRSHVVEYR